MQLLLKRVNNAFIPSSDESVEVFSKIKEGEDIMVDYKRHRNVGNHKRLFSMLQQVVQNTDKYKTVDNLLSVIKLKSGYFETVVSHKSEVFYIPKSINFASMSEDEFQTFFSKAIDVCLELVDDESMNMILRYA
jgi:hypothetical protein